MRVSPAWRWGGESLGRPCCSQLIAIVAAQKNDRSGPEMALLVRVRPGGGHRLAAGSHTRARAPG